MDKFLGWLTCSGFVVDARYRYTVNDVIRGNRVDRGLLGRQRDGFEVSAEYINHLFVRMNLFEITFGVLGFNCWYRPRVGRR